MHKTRVMVHELGYDLEFDVTAFDATIDDIDSSVEVESEVYEEYLQIKYRLEELVDYFCSFKSVNQKKQWDEHIARVLAEEAAQIRVQEMLKCAPDFSGRKPRSLNIGEIR